MKESLRTRDAWYVWAQNLLTLCVLFLGPLTRGTSGGLLLWMAGGAALVAGGFFGLAGVRDLGRHRSPYPEPKADGELVTHGIYRHVRHPLYTSLVFLGIGWSLVWASWPSSIAALVLAAVLHAKAGLEEKLMQNRFPGYDHYARGTRRFIPWIY